MSDENIHASYKKEIPVTSQSYGETWFIEPSAKKFPFEVMAKRLRD
jgi:hypothetical protein